MAKLPKNLLTAAVMTATAASFAPATFAADDAEFNFSTRTFYFNRDFREGPEDRIALTQALRGDFVSATLADRFRIGASVFANLKLDGQKNDAGTALLKVDSNGDTEVYAKLGQLYLDAKLTDDVNLRLGRMVLGTPLLNDPDNRATPSSSQAIVLTAKPGNADLYAIYTDKAVTKTETSFTEYSANGQDYDIVVLGGGYAFDNGLGVHVAYGKADDYQKQLYLNTNYTIDLGNSQSLLLDLYHYDGEADGNLYSNPDYNSTMTNLAARYTMGNLKLTASYQTIGGDDAYDYGWGGPDSSLPAVWNSVQFNDFNRKDEDSFQLRADYSFPAVPGLSGFARHTMGTYDNNGIDVDEAETNLDMTYSFQSGALKGLSLRARLAHISADAYSDINEVRFIANYRF